MKKIITITLVLTLTLGLMLTARAQDELYVYRHGGVTDTLKLSEVTNISHSRVDLQGRQHDDFVLMDVTLADGSVRQFPLEGLDSVVMQRDGERYRLVRFTGGMSSNSGNGIRKALRRTSLEVFNVSESSEDGTEFFWADGDNIFITTASGDHAMSDSVNIREGKAVADFFFNVNNITIPNDNVEVYYSGNTPQDYNVVQVTKTQTQSAPSNSEHIGRSGDCGTAVATKVQGKDSYNFVLDHKASYLCFLPYIANGLGRTVLEKITVRSDSTIAGTFTLTPERIIPKKDTTHVITLTTSGHFVLPRQASLENSAAYMVIAPQNGSTRLTCEFTVRDTVLQSTGVYTKTVDLDEVKSNMVYVVKANCNNYVVDLGLPVKFLNHNMGAFAPEEYGGYYSYGELDDKGNYANDATNYSHYNTPRAEIANIRLTQYDVAHIRLGGSFSIPTMAEFKMLVDSCTWTWLSSFNGKPGYKITGKNGNTLFMPAAGYRSGTGNSDINTRGCYRTSQLVPVSSGAKINWYLNFYNNSRSVPHSGEDIYLGESIRPVVSTGVQMTDGTLVQVMTDSVGWTPTQLTAKLYGTVYGISKAKTAVELGFVVGANDTIKITSAGTTTVQAAATTTDGKYFADFTMPKDTVYYIRAYAKDKDDNIEYGNALQFGRCYVDLGLPSGTKWANINVGATRPDEDGNYFAWAETEPKSSYTDDNYKWSLEKTWVFPDGLRNVQATHNDAASMNWKGVWMLPDYADLCELVNNCTSESVKLNNISGYRLTSNKNGKSIFFTLSGYRDSGLNDYASRSCLASSEIHPYSVSKRGTNSDAYFISYASVSDGWYRRDGISVRPVYKTNATSAAHTDMYVRTLPAKKQYNGTTETNTLWGVIRGVESAGNGTSYGFVYWKKGSQDVATVNAVPDNEGYISHAITTGLTAGSTYRFAAFVDNGSGELATGDTLEITTIGMVDLGLSVKWANVNIGAEAEEATGDYYRWGAIVPYRNTAQQYTVPKDITPQSGYDIATNLWGSRYRMPTKAEMEELVSGCDHEWVTRNGINGYLFTGKGDYADRSIFLPAAGWFNGSNGAFQYQYQSYGDYWTSTVIDNDNAYRIQFYSTSLPVGSDSKVYGFPIRAVQDPLANIETRAIARNTKGTTEIDTLRGFFSSPTGAALTRGFVYGTTADIKVGQPGVTDCQVAGTSTGGTFSYPVTGLSKGTRYYYRAYVTDGSTYQYAPARPFELVRMIDLGLSSGLLFSNVNLGSNTPEEFGDHYAWGETEPKEEFTQSNYKYYNNGWIDIGTNIGGTQYDAATANMGLLWRLPTQVEHRELINACNWSKKTINGVSCWLGKSKTTGDSIIIPNAMLMDGLKYYSSYLDCALNMASDRYSETTSRCLYFHGSSSTDAGDNNGELKYRGYTVRAVCSKPDTLDVAYGIVGRIVTDSCSWSIGDATATLHGTFAASETLSGMTYGFIVGTMQDVATDTPDGSKVPLANADSHGHFTYNVSYGSQLYYRAFIYVNNKYFFGAIKAVTAAKLLTCDFLPDGNAVNSAPNTFTFTKHGSPTVTWNSDYQHYEADFSGNVYDGEKNTGTNAAPNFYYSTWYHYFDEFKNHLADGHSIEVLLKVPSTIPSNNESNAFASYHNGGSGIGIQNKKIETMYYVSSNYREVRTTAEIETNMYYHVVATWSKTEGKIILYINGIKNSELSQTGNYGHPNQDQRYYTVGGDPDGSYSSPHIAEGWSGKVVFTRIYDEVLTDSQVSTLYNYLPTP